MTVPLRKQLDFCVGQLVLMLRCLRDFEAEHTMDPTLEPIVVQLRQILDIQAVPADGQSDNAVPADPVGIVTADRDNEVVRDCGVQYVSRTAKGLVMDIQRLVGTGESQPEPEPQPQPSGSRPPESNIDETIEVYRSRLRVLMRELEDNRFYTTTVSSLPSGSRSRRHRTAKTMHN